MSGQRARFTQILRHCRYDATVLDLATDSPRTTKKGHDVNPADECPANVSSRLALPIRENRRIFRPDSTRITPFRLCSSKHLFIRPLFIVFGSPFEFFSFFFLFYLIITCFELTVDCWGSLYFFYREFVCLMIVTWTFLVLDRCY